jgi:uncharacterized protein YbjT (DUF2867 family)
MILITGATGNNGVELINIFRRAELRRAFIQNQAQAWMIALPGVEIVEGNFTQPKHSSGCLQAGIVSFWLIPSSSDVEAQQRSFIDAAKRSGVRHIVNLSQLVADVRSSGRFQRYHGVVEDYIGQRADGLHL